MRVPPLIASIAYMVVLSGCHQVPVIDRSGFVAAVLMPDHRTIAFAYRVLRYRNAEGVAAFPDGGVPTYLVDRMVIGTCDISGGAPRILQRMDNPWTHSTDSLIVRVEAQDPTHFLLSWGGQPSPSAAPRARWYRIDPVTGTAALYPDLARELAVSGRTLGCRPFGDVRVVDPDGTLLIGATGPDGDEVLVRSPHGEIRELDVITQFYGVAGSEAYYWTTGNVAVVRDWRSFQARVIARYDPTLKQTRTLIRPDPTVSAIDASQPDARIGAALADDHSGLTVGTRDAQGGWSYRPIPLDVAPLSR